MAAEITTIKLSKKSKDRLDKFKVYSRETYEEVLLSMIDILNLCRQSPEQARQRLSQLDQQRRQRQGSTTEN